MLLSMGKDLFRGALFFDEENVLTINMIKNMLKRRKESDAYLATDGRHRRGLKMTMKNDN